MDRARLIIGYEWRAYWRRFIRAGLRRGNQGILLIASLLIAAKYVQLLRHAAANVANGQTRLLESLLAAVFLTWLFPLASVNRDTLASPRWLHLPLTIRERFIVRTASLLFAPAAWLVVAGSLAIGYPLAYAHHPVAGVVAGWLFVVSAWFTGLTLSHLLHSRTWRRILWGLALIALAFAGHVVAGAGSPRSLLEIQFFPALMVQHAAMGTIAEVAVALAVLAVLMIASGVAAMWSFRGSLVSEARANNKRLRVSASSLPGRLGGLIAKDFRYFRKLLDSYLGLAAAILAALYLLVATEPSAGVFWSFIVVIFLCNGSLAFNSFGLDNRRGMSRYSLLPVTGRSILLSKNLAYILIVIAQLLPALLIALWRLGLQASLLGLVESVILASAYLAWGNWMSVNHPLKMEFYRFANSSAAIVDVMGGIIFGSLPGILLIYMWQTAGRNSAVITTIVFLVFGFLYLLSLRLFGNRFDRRRERVAEVLI